MPRNKKRIRSTACPNCQKIFADVDHNYCPYCGQENHTHKLPVKHFVMETLESLTHFDTKFLVTVKHLFLKPGLVIKNFNENKRARYVPPIRIYVFISFIFFLLFSFLFSHQVEENNKEFRNGINEGANIQIGFSTQTTIDSVTLNKLKEIPILTNESINKTLKANNIPTNWFNTRMLNSLLKIQSGELTFSDLYKKIIKYFSYSLFLFMPLFAWVLKLFYIRKNYYYSEFLVFSIYYHAFIFGLISILLTVEKIFNLEFGLIISIFALMIFIYLGLALKIVFRGSLAKTIFKTVLLSVIYTFISGTLFAFLIIGSMI